MAQALTATAVVTDAAEVVQRHIELHRHRLCYLEAGQNSGGPVIVLLHGLASESTTWLELMPLLGRHAHVLAPDMLGHGNSAKPACGDYSVGAHAARLRDLLRELGIERASVVGHSFGGGVAMSFAYQFPERTDRLVLIASGGLGPELNLALRAASLPGAALTAHALTSFTPQWLRGLARNAALGLGLAPSTDLDALARALSSLTDRGTREAFVHTLRGTVTWSGQRLTATDLLHLLSGLPILLIAGRHDTCIPYHHTLHAHRQLPGSRLEILEAGHFPHHKHPRTVAHLIAQFSTSSAGDFNTDHHIDSDRPAC